MLVMLAQASAGLIETYFVGQLGTDALTGMVLVFPLVMLRQMTSAGAVGGGIASAVARARRTALRRCECAGAACAADRAGVRAAVHGCRVARRPGLLRADGRQRRFAGGGADLLELGLRGRGARLVVQLDGSADSRHRQHARTGRRPVPARCCWCRCRAPSSSAGAPAGPGHCRRHAGVAGLLRARYAGAAAVFRVAPQPVATDARSSEDPLGTVRRHPKVGLVGTISTLATNLAIAIATAQVGRFGTAAIAGYGTASRLEYLLMPLVFGLGGPLVAMVGTCIGAGQRERAWRAAWVGAGMAGVMAELIGLAVAVRP